VSARAALGLPRSSSISGAGVISAFLTALLALALASAAVPAGAAPALSIMVSGNHFVNGSGQTVRLLGVNRSSTEYACFYGYGYASGPLEAADAAAIAAWHANAVRIPLNEDCWLGINGSPAGALTAAGYRQAIESYVQDLNADGLYAILDLHWSAPGSTPANGQRAMPDEHSLEFWRSVAGAFASDPAVLFDAFNEPFSPAADGESAYPVSWSCWQDGGCEVPDASDQEAADPARTYTAVGMQQVVDAIRSAGASQPIMLGGLGYANNLSQWLDFEPTDPDGQLAASFHNYTGESCDSESCWTATIAPLAAQVPVVTGEFDEDDCPPSGQDPANFDNTYMAWADQHGVSYLAWGWFVLEEPSCSALSLITDYEGAPAEPNGVALYDHLAGLASAASGEEAAPMGLAQMPGDGDGSSVAGSASSAAGAGAMPTGLGGAGAQAAAGDRQALSSALKALVGAVSATAAARLLGADGWHLRFRAPEAGELTLSCSLVATAPRRTRLIAYVRRAFSHAATASLELRLTAAGRRLLAHRRTLRVRLTATFKQRDSSDRASATRSV
jgi:endoglucanase